MTASLRILVTGARALSDADRVMVFAALRRVTAEALADGVPVVIIEGDCPFGGVDLAAREWGEGSTGVTVETYPPDRRSTAAYHARNQQMVDSGADWCLAFPAPGSRGTWDCLRRAAEAGIPGRVYPLGMWGAS